MILKDLTKFLNSYKNFIIKIIDIFSNNKEINKEEPEEKINYLKTLKPSTKEEFHNFLRQIMTFIEKNEYHSYSGLNNLSSEIFEKFPEEKKYINLPFPFC